MIFYYLVLAGLICALLAYLLFEIHYFMRLGITVLLARITKKKLHILDETTVQGVCLTTDIDTLLTHKNNARFLRELDFAKVDFYERTGFYRSIKKHGGSFFIVATTIRYRRFIKLFSRYRTTTRIIYWDQQHVYIEHKFMTKPDDFVNAIVMCRLKLLNCNADKIINELLDKYSEDVEYGKKEKPAMPLELAKWIESNEISSVNLRRIS